MRHIECSENEEWVGNTCRASGRLADLHAQGVVTARYGNQAFDVEGKPLPQDQYAPLIISRAQSPLYDQLMVERSKRD